LRDLPPAGDGPERRAVHPLQAAGHGLRRLPRLMRTGGRATERMGARVVLVTLLLALCLPARAVESPVAPAFSLLGRRTPAVQDSATTGGPHGAIALTCEACNTPEAWRPLLRPLPFDLDRHTAFPLTGRHRQADCRACHL